MNDVTRRRNPEALRRQLIDCAVVLAHEKGLNAVTVEAVSRAAGVTKGGLFHHFESKQALVDAVFYYVLDLFEGEIRASMARDPEPLGRFTRAYLDVTFLGAAETGESLVLWFSMVAEPRLARRWSDWMQAMVNEHAETDLTPDLALRLEAVRFAADGIWIGQAAQVHPRDTQALHDMLRRATFPKD